jgi:hypothetical protein
LKNKKIKIFFFQNLSSYQKFLDPSNIERDQLFKSKCDSLMKQFNLSINRNDEKNHSSIETPQKMIADEQVSLPLTD